MLYTCNDAVCCGAGPLIAVLLATTITFGAVLSAWAAMFAVAGFLLPVLLGLGLLSFWGFGFGMVAMGLVPAMVASVSLSIGLPTWHWCIIVLWEVTSLCTSSWERGGNHSAGLGCCSPRRFAWLSFHVACWQRQRRS